MNEKLRAKLAERGVDPEQFMQKLSQYVGSQGQAFKTPQEYGRAIQQKRAAGQTLSDPETARIFESLTAPKRQTTTIPFPTGTFTPPQGMPGGNLIQAVMRYQRANPITIPYAPGTPTLATRQAEEAMRAQAAAEALAGEKWDWQKQQAELDRQMQEREFAANQAYRAAQLALSRAASGGSAPEATIDPKIWADSAKIARDRWDKSEEYVWVNRETGEMIKEDVPGVKPLEISPFDLNWERQSTTRVPFDSLPDAQKNKMIYEVYHSTTLLPFHQGLDPSLSPSELPDAGSREYYHSLANQARQAGYADSDISKWLVERHEMPVTYLPQLNLPPIDMWQTARPSQYQRR